MTQFERDGFDTHAGWTTYRSPTASLSERPRFVARARTGGAGRAADFVKFLTKNFTVEEYSLQERSDG